MKYPSGGVSVDLRNPYCPWSTAPLQMRDGNQSYQVWARGHAWEGGHYLEGQTLADRLRDVLTADATRPRSLFEEALARFDGFYALVAVTPQGFLVAVDHLRSIPLFYGSKGQHLLLSDDAYAVRAFVGDQSFDDLSVKEFLLTGYVTGSATVCPHVKQLQAGEYLRVVATDPVTVQCTRYYRYIQGDYFQGEKQALYRSLQTAYDEVFDLLVRRAGGRQIVVPLSGGIDSRCVAAMLRLKRAANVFCFTYGVPDDWEVQIAAAVADSLGYEWAFVPYSRASWRRWAGSDEMRAYSLWASGLVSIPHVQDWPAIWELRKAGRIADGALIVPGIIVARDVPPQPQGESLSKAVAYVLKRHYRHWEWDDGRELLERAFRRKILSSVMGSDRTGRLSGIDAYERWGAQELHPKFNVNSVRAYEFWGCDWGLPLHSRPIMDFWARVPANLRVKKGLIRAYLEERVFSPSGVGGMRPPDARAPRNRLGSVHSRLTNPYLGSCGLLDMLSSWFDHSRAFGGRWRSLGHLLSVNSVGTAETLRAWKGDL